MLAFTIAADWAFCCTLSFYTAAAAGGGGESCKRKFSLLLLLSIRHVDSAKRERNAPFQLLYTLASRETRTRYRIVSYQCWRRWWCWWCSATAVETWLQQQNNKRRKEGRKKERRKSGGGWMGMAPMLQLTWRSRRRRRRRHVLFLYLLPRLLLIIIITATRRRRRRRATTRLSYTPWDWRRKEERAKKNAQGPNKTTPPPPLLLLLLLLRRVPTERISPSLSHIHAHNRVVAPKEEEEEGPCRRRRRRCRLERDWGLEGDLMLCHWIVVSLQEVELSWVGEVIGYVRGVLQKRRRQSKQLRIQYIIAYVRTTTTTTGTSSCTVMQYRWCVGVGGRLKCRVVAFVVLPISLDCPPRLVSCSSSSSSGTWHADVQTRLLYNDITRAGQGRAGQSRLHRVFLRRNNAAAQLLLLRLVSSLRARGL